MSDKPTDTDRSLGELRMGLDAMFRRIAEMEARLRRLEDPQTMTGGIEGMAGEIVVTMPEGWFE